MNKSNMITIILAVLVVVLLVYLSLDIKVENRNLDEPEMSSYPNDWIDTNNEVSEINVSESTSAKGDYSLGFQRYIDTDNSIRAFYATGAYNGIPFKTSYIMDEKVLFRIAPEMKPSDGIPEGFILVKREDQNLNAYIFVDEDWKTRSNGNIFITYGDNISNKEGLAQERYDFSNSQDGVYIDSITGLNWLIEQDPIVGRLFVGELDKDDIMMSDYNHTFIMLT